MTDNNFGRRQMNEVSVIVPSPPVQASTMKFFHFRQNNSGGSFDYDHARGIGESVWIEAIDRDQAIYRAERIGIYFDGIDSGRDCPCCGDRWSRPYDFDTVDAPDVEKWTHGSYIHYANGHVTMVQRVK